jgi:hypothetical protein
VTRLYQTFEAPYFPICNITLALVTTPPEASQIDLKPIMVNQVELYQRELPEEARS